MARRRGGRLLTPGGRRPGEVRLSRAEAGGAARSPTAGGAGVAPGGPGGGGDSGPAPPPGRPASAPAGLGGGVPRITGSAFLVPPPSGLGGHPRRAPAELSALSYASRGRRWVCPNERAGGYFLNLSTRPVPGGLFHSPSRLRSALQVWLRCGLPGSWLCWTSFSARQVAEAVGHLCVSIVKLAFRPPEPERESAPGKH